MVPQRPQTLSKGFGHPMRNFFLNYSGIPPSLKIKSNFTDPVGISKPSKMFTKEKGVRIQCKLITWMPVKTENKVILKFVPHNLSSWGVITFFVTEIFTYTRVCACTYQVLTHQISHKIGLCVT